MMVIINPPSGFSSHLPLSNLWRLVPSNQLRDHPSESSSSFLFLMCSPAFLYFTFYCKFPTSIIGAGLQDEEDAPFPLLLLLAIADAHDLLECLVFSSVLVDMVVQKHSRGWLTDPLYGLGMC